MVVMGQAAMALDMVGGAIPFRRQRMGSERTTHSGLSKVNTELSAAYEKRSGAAPAATGAYRA